MILSRKLMFVIVLISVLFVRKAPAQEPSVPCPNIFHYARSNNKNIGIITIDKFNLGETEIEIELSQAGSIYSDFLGDLDLNFDVNEIGDYIESGKAVTYEVNFAYQNVTPQVSSIRVNGAEICPGPEAPEPRTTVTLRHIVTVTPKDSTEKKSGNSKTEAQTKITRTTSTTNSKIGDFDIKNFLSSSNTQLDDPFFKDAADLFSKGTSDIDLSNILSSSRNRLNSDTFFKDAANLFNSRNNDVEKVENTPTTTTTTTTTTPPPPPPPPPPTTPERNPTAFLDVLNGYRPTIQGPPSNIMQESSIHPPIMRSSSQWSYIDSVCGQENTDFTAKKLAVNGVEVPRAKFPWIVALFKKNVVGSLTFQCGGSLISTRTVISAAHCFYSGFSLLRDEDILVSMGRHNLTDWTDSYITQRDVQKIIRHPDYRPEVINVDADLAIIQLKQSVTFSPAIRPVCLWRGRFEVSAIEGVLGTVVGWGKDENNNAVTTAPRLITAIVVSELTCIRSNNQLVYLTSNRTLCAGNRDGTGPCNGDSGSGLMIRNGNKWMIRGTVSSALRNQMESCNLDEYVVYTDIAQFIGWIYDNSVF